MCPKWAALKAAGTYVPGVPNRVDARKAHIADWVRTWPAEMAKSVEAAGLALDDAIVLTDEAAEMATLLPAVSFMHSRFFLGEVGLAMPPGPDGRRQLRFVTVGPPVLSGAFGAGLLGLEPLDGE